HVLDVARQRGHTFAARRGGTRSPSGRRNFRRLASAGGPSPVAGGSGTTADTYGAGGDRRVSGDSDAAAISRFSPGGPRGVGAIQDAVGGLGLGPTAQQNRRGLSHGASARRNVG